MAKINVYIYIKRGYDDFCGFGQEKNKANSKPNKANLLAFSFQRQDKEGNLKKQSQFAGGKINTRRLKTMVYGDFGQPGQRKNKANSKPIRANPWLLERNPTTSAV